MFRALPPPSDAEVARVVMTVRRRVLRLLARRGYGQDAGAAPDLLAEESPVLSGIRGASVLGHVALGRRADARVWGPGSEPEAPWIASTGPRHAHLDGFDLHADLRVAGHDRRRLEHLCRYLLRPLVAQERLRLLADGRGLVQLKRVWADGTSHLLFEPLEFLEKLAALTPRPRINHGVLGPHARWRSRIVPGPAMRRRLRILGSWSRSSPTSGCPARRCGRTPPSRLLPPLQTSSPTRSPERLPVGLPARRP